MAARFAPGGGTAARGVRFVVGLRVVAMRSRYGVIVTAARYPRLVATGAEMPNRDWDGYPECFLKSTGSGHLDADCIVVGENPQIVIGDLPG